jgi:hypothetical protein
VDVVAAAAADFSRVRRVIMGLLLGMLFVIGQSCAQFSQCELARTSRIV